MEKKTLIAFSVGFAVLILAAIALFMSGRNRDTSLLGSSKIIMPAGIEKDNLPLDANGKIDRDKLLESVPKLELSANIEPLQERDKFKKIDFANRLSAPKFDTKLKLYVATGPGKPAKLPAAVSRSEENLIETANSSWKTPLASLSVPSIKTPTLITPPKVITPTIKPPLVKPPVFGPVFIPNNLRYTDAPYNAFIDYEGDRKRYFAFNLDSSEAKKVVWQVSKVPFSGYSKDWKIHGGLVASGEVDASKKEFTIDFGSFAPSPKPELKLWKLNTNGAFGFTGEGAIKEIPINQRTYYVRAVPLNSSGNPIGDPGTGIEVIYGKPIPESKKSLIVNPSFEIWNSYRDVNESSAEFPAKFLHDTDKELIYNCQPNSSPRWFQFKNVDSSAYRLVVQVSTSNFTNDEANWENPDNLVYSKTYDNLPVKINQSFPNAISVPFMDFGPSPDEIGDRKVIYYVRAVALRQSTQKTGAVKPLFSETQRVKYARVENAVTIYQNKTITVPANAPTIVSLKYVPARWEDYEWSHYFTVVRPPKWNEINFSLYNKKTNEYLVPYPLHKMIYPNDTKEYYENNVVAKFLPVGAGFKVVTKEENKSWWGELWDSIVDFFKSIADIIAKVVNWASKTYANFKSAVIDFVAKNFPIYPESLRDEFKTALTILVDTGLAAIGIPPGIPNFDELAEGGLDYCLKVALEQANIPADALTDAAKEELKNQIKEKIKESAQVEGPNPFNAGFLKNDPAYQYRPAYVEFVLKNNNKVASPTGSFLINFEGEKWPYLPVFERKSEVIPSLNQGESTTVRVYLKEYVNKPYADNFPYVPGDFEKMYFGSDNLKSTFTLSIKYNLPEVNAAAAAMNLDKNLPKGYIYTFRYDKEYDSYSFTGVPCNSYTK